MSQSFLRWLSLTAGSLLASPATGCLIETSRFLDGSFENERTALARVVAVIGRDSRNNDVEYVGALYRVNGRVKLNLGRGCPGRDAFTARLPVPTGYKLTAFWHTHGAKGTHRDRFSLQDFQLVRTQRRPFYLITPAGELRVLQPGMRVRQGAMLGRLEAVAEPAQSARYVQSSIRPINR